jgi:hypothetical protein
MSRWKGFTMDAGIESQLIHLLETGLAPREADALQRLLIRGPEARQACYDLLIKDHLLDSILVGEETPSAPQPGQPDPGGCGLLLEEMCSNPR